MYFIFAELIFAKLLKIRSVKSSLYTIFACGVKEKEKIPKPKAKVTQYIM